MATERSIEKLLDDMANSEFDTVQARLSNMEDKELYHDRTLPVDIIDFCLDPQYLGDSVKVDPQVLQLLSLIENPRVNEAFIQIGKGSGKSLVGSIFPVYGAYLLNKMRRPHLFFNISPVNIISSINVSIGQTQAKEVIFNQIKALIEQSPWFNKNTHFIPLSIEVSFPDRKITLYCGHSNSNAFLGFATFRGVLDETNFMVNNQNRNVASDLFNALKGSGTTRFPQHYKLLAISSASTPGAWLQEEVNSIKRAGKEIPLNPNGITRDIKHQQTNEHDDQMDSILEGIIDEV